MTSDKVVPFAPVALPRPVRWGEFSRQEVLATIEEASGQSLSANDPLPDTLIAQAQVLGLRPIELRLWIYDDPGRRDWDAQTLARWARRFGLGAYGAAALDSKA